MPYKEHPKVALTAGDDARVWRFIDLPKLLSLIEDRALYFARLGTFEDPYEGRVSRPVAESMRGAGEHPDVTAMQRLRTVESARELLYVSAWHLNEHESAAMWSVYSTRGHGMAVRSSVGRLKASVAEDPRDVLIGEVRYSDYDTDADWRMNVIDTGYRKRKSYEHERELRLGLFDAGAPQDGKHVRVEVERLIERIYVAPTSEAWLLDLVKRFVKKSGLSADVLRSGLLDGPVY